MDAPLSIFNNVIGPVMRGPSSSHCAAGVRIGSVARDLMGGDIRKVSIVFDEHGSLATTHESHGSDMGLFGGLLGWPVADERLPDSHKAIKDHGIEVDIRTENLHDPHPNTYRLSLENETERHSLTAVSTGGGMIRVIDIDGIALELGGDYYETLFFVSGRADELAAKLSGCFDAESVVIYEGGKIALVHVKADRFVDDGLVEKIIGEYEVEYVKNISPVLPVLSRKDMSVPFTNCREMLEYVSGREESFWQLAVEYESRRGGISGREVIERMTGIVKVVRNSIEQGIRGTSHEDRILGYQCGRLKQKMEADELLPAGVANRIVVYVTALMEVKSAMGVIVAAPTAGACAALPGACLAVSDEMGLGDEDAARALLAAGLVGVFIAEVSTFAAEEAGCQAECGSASGMAAAAMATLAGGSMEQVVAAASMALQNSLGMVCDPVANRVEVPCLGKNVMAAVNALACANMALADYDPVVPLDEVIEAMDAVGRSIPRELRCTALGGLSVTKTSKEIELQLRRNRNENTS